MSEQLTLWQATTSNFAPLGGCFLHDEAYELLTADWQRLGQLKSERLSPGVFDDLVSWGCADFLVEAIGRVNQEGQFRCFGCRQWYRLGTGVRDTVEVEENS